MRSEPPIIRRSLVIILAALVLVTLGFAQRPASGVHQLYLQDQHDRGVGGPSVSSWKELNRRDKERREQVRALIDQGKLKTGEDFHDAAYIFQHGHSPADYLLAHVLAIDAISKGNDSRWIAAATLDRYLQSIKQPQVFGTQYFQAGTAPYTQQPYDPKIISDRLRGEFCVPSVEQQKKNVKFFDAGKYPPGILPPGCTR